MNATGTVNDMPEPEGASDAVLLSIRPGQARMRFVTVWPKPRGALFHRRPPTVIPQAVNSGSIIDVDLTDRTHRAGGVRSPVRRMYGEHRSH